MMVIAFILLPLSPPPAVRMLSEHCRIFDKHRGIKPAEVLVAVPGPLAVLPSPRASEKGGWCESQTAYDSQLISEITRHQPNHILKDT